jgi:hypothetical protein
LLKYTYDYITESYINNHVIHSIQHIKAHHIITFTYASDPRHAPSQIVASPFQLQESDSVQQPLHLCFTSAGIPVWQVGVDLTLSAKDWRISWMFSDVSATDTVLNKLLMSSSEMSAVGAALGEELGAALGEELGAKVKS